MYQHESNLLPRVRSGTYTLIWFEAHLFECSRIIGGSSELVYHAQFCEVPFLVLSSSRLWMLLWIVMIHGHLISLSPGWTIFNRWFLDFQYCIDSTSNLSSNLYKNNSKESTVSPTASHHQAALYIYPVYSGDSMNWKNEVTFTSFFEWYH